MQLLIFFADNVAGYIEVAEYPDGRIELWADGASLPYATYDRFPEVDQGAIVATLQACQAGWVDPWMPFCQPPKGTLLAGIDRTTNSR
ncbi:hypothetical protein [Cupriavidus pauculus]|uniref:hypothetical protein n=1 Tax=Cupriavidus pauculus TaxID=82633 RepID=UPI001EE33B08|nr:hypothetical protein [Cupriavidus pauculus]GJG98501.1 hypothetical protein CBA19C6_28450 [Cupriavidus pauculus]